MREAVLVAVIQALFVDLVHSDLQCAETSSGLLHHTSQL